MEGVAGIVAPADDSFPGAGYRSAPASNLPVEYAPLRRKGKRAVKSPNFTAHFFDQPSGVRALSCEPCTNEPLAPC